MKTYKTYKKNPAAEAKIKEHNEEKLDKMPLIESNIFKSKSGDYVIHRTVITDIRPTSYYEKVMESEPQEAEKDRHGFRLFKL